MEWNLVRMCAQEEGVDQRVCMCTGEGSRPKAEAYVRRGIEAH